MIKFPFGFPIEEVSEEMSKDDANVKLRSGWWDLVAIASARDEENNEYPIYVLIREKPFSTVAYELAMKYGFTERQMGWVIKYASKEKIPLEKASIILSSDEEKAKEEADLELAAKNLKSKEPVNIKAHVEGKTISKTTFVLKE
jgi:hypothetical protein